MYVCVDTYMYTGLFIYLCIDPSVCLYIYIYTYIHLPNLYIYIYIYTCICTHV